MAPKGVDFEYLAFRHIKYKYMFTTQAHSQYIKVGPIEADTGNDFLDFGFVIILVVLIAVVWKYKG